MEENLTLDSEHARNESALSHKSLKHLLEAARWAKFLSIVTFIFVGLSIIMIIVAAAGIASYTGIGGYGAITVILYILLLGLYLVPGFYLFNFAVKMKSGIVQGKTYEVEDAFEAIKSFFKFIGILTIVILSIWLLSLLISLLA